MVPYLEKKNIHTLKKEQNNVKSSHDREYSSLIDKKRPKEDQRRPEYVPRVPSLVKTGPKD